MDEGDEREEKGGVSDAQLSQEIAARDNEVTGLLRRKDKVRALILSLQNPPIATKSAAVKVCCELRRFCFVIPSLFLFVNIKIPSNEIFV